MENKGSCKVCVTGGAGYIGSSLVQLLLQNGYTVHATLRNLGDESKVGLLKSFPFAEERLHLFKADIYNPEEFEEAIQGCVYVFHVATPFFHTTGYKYNNTIDATINALKEIADACIRSGTVKRLIYTASVTAASPLKEDGSGYKTIIDESCWTPLHLGVPYTNDYLKDYTEAKTKSEQEALKIGEDKANELEVVTLCCGLVGGGILRSGSPSVFISQISNDMTQYKPLRYLEELLGKVPIVHIDDVCRAHIFCAETPSVNGRFLCASSFVSTGEMAKYYQKRFPLLKQEYLEERGIEIKWGSRKLEDKGFAYKYSTEMILDDCLEYGKRSGIV
ncbi:anthocyanidin reductase ((2S)-flavan-3-ol-forming)-like protein [Tanacetum coccineum]